jgi:hypothetical protein
VFLQCNAIGAATSTTLLVEVESCWDDPSWMKRVGAFGNHSVGYGCEYPSQQIGPLRFLLNMLFGSSTDEATDRFMRNTVCCCHGAQRFLLLYHAMHDHRPVFSGNTVLRMFWPWSPFANNWRRAGVMCIVVSEQVLHLEIKIPRRSKEEVENWRQRSRNPSVPVLLFMHLSSKNRTYVLSHHLLLLYAGSLVSTFSHRLFNHTVLMALLHINSTRRDLQFVRFSHYSRTDRPSSQHRGS